MCPSTAPENTTPGIAVIAADCAGLQLGRSPHTGGGADQTFLPVAASSANNPPPALGSTSSGFPVVNSLRRKSISLSATYMFFPSLAEPHWIPPSAPPLPTRVSHRTLPL